MKKEKPIWDKKLPKDHKPHHLTSNQKASAKARAKAHNRPYPNAVDNFSIARRSGHK